MVIRYNLVFQKSQDFCLMKQLRDSSQRHWLQSVLLKLLKRWPKNAQRYAVFSRNALGIRESNSATILIKRWKITISSMTVQDQAALAYKDYSYLMVFDTLKIRNCN